jgi:hypothetical protein
METRDVICVFVVGLCIVMAIVAFGFASNLYGMQKTNQQKDCISAGMQYVQTATGHDYECKVISK